MASPRIPLDKAHPGLVVAEDIRDPRGRVLIPAQARMTPMLIKRLQQWRVEFIRVENPDCDEARDASSPGAAPDNGTPGRDGARPGTRATSEAHPLPAAAEPPPEEMQAYMRSTAERAMNRFELVMDQPLMRDLMLLTIRCRIARGPGGIPGVEEDDPA